MGKAMDLTNKKFGRWTIFKKTENYCWFCKCLCGTNRKVSVYSLLHGKSKSCGCLQKERTIEKATKHGLAKTALYKIWTSMKQRCNNPKDKGFKNYGGRGIKVCSRWNRVENFVMDMGNRPYGLTIERVNRNGNYEPSNCIWATRTVQNRNSRRNKYIVYRGQEKCLAEWAHILGVKPQVLDYRVKNYPVEEAFDFSKKVSSKRIECQGEEKTITEWAKKLGIKHGTLWWRLQHHPPQIALNM